ncbi:hypothetical protein AB0F15_31425 [Amycolatopsis sp. NPDC026612]|uniref:hypothetical protein n=1 Tax=Amycolatopsis sp. NPDC026612 TaxID=3155466 RepID=UPI0033F9E9BB
MPATARRTSPISDRPIQNTEKPSETRTQGASAGPVLCALTSTTATLAHAGSGQLPEGPAHSTSTRRSSVRKSRAWRTAWAGPAGIHQPVRAHASSATIVSGPPSSNAAPAACSRASSRLAAIMSLTGWVLPSRAGSSAGSAGPSHGTPAAAMPGQPVLAERDLDLYRAVEVVAQVCLPRHPRRPGVVLGGSVGAARIPGFVVEAVREQQREQQVLQQGFQAVLDVGGVAGDCERLPDSRAWVENATA